uniref:Uncharacterized protein n=1 Tax=Arundo donax TaxID=35708 RepID=A0A0A9GJW0_ARUDO
MLQPPALAVAVRPAGRRRRAPSQHRHGD